MNENNKAKVIKTCDLPGGIAAELFRMLNADKVTIDGSGSNIVIVTDVEPKELTYPEGWYYAKGTFRNKHQSTTGGYDEIYLITADRKTWWRELAKYSTL